MTALDDLKDRLFVSAPEAAAILGRDARTIRKAAEAGEIPARKAGRKWLIPTEWIRAEAGMSAAAATAGFDYDKLAELVDRQSRAQMAAVFARLAAALVGEPGGV